MRIPQMKQWWSFSLLSLIIPSYLTFLTILQRWSCHLRFLVEVKSDNPLSLSSFICIGDISWSDDILQDILRLWSNLQTARMRMFTSTEHLILGWCAVFYYKCSRAVKRKILGEVATCRNFNVDKQKWVREFCKKSKQAQKVWT